MHVYNEHSVNYYYIQLNACIYSFIAFNIASKTKKVPTQLERDANGCKITK